MSNIDYNLISKNVFDKSSLNNLGTLKVHSVFINEHCEKQMAERLISLPKWDIFDMVIFWQKDSNSHNLSTVWYKWIIKASWGYLICKVFKHKISKDVFIKILSVLKHDQLASSRNLLYGSHWKSYLSIIIEDWIIWVKNKDSQVLAKYWIVLKPGIQNSTLDFYFSDDKFIDTLLAISNQFWYDEIKKFRKIDSIPIWLDQRKVFNVESKDGQIKYSLTYSESGKLIIES